MYWEIKNIKASGRYSLGVAVNNRYISINTKL
jgi:hypothetical protein